LVAHLDPISQLHAPVDGYQHPAHDVLDDVLEAEVRRKPLSSNDPYGGAVSTPKRTRIAMVSAKPMRKVLNELGHGLGRGAPAIFAAWFLMIQ